jgi:peptidoglycan hydrolase-like protein with peptidoglycan-binding domain
MGKKDGYIDVKGEVLGPKSGNTEEIKDVEGALGLPRDGVYDRDLIAAVKKFQKENKIKPTGLVGETTAAEINRKENERSISYEEPRVPFHGLDKILGQLVPDSATGKRDPIIKNGNFR